MKSFNRTVIALSFGAALIGCFESTPIDKLVSSTAKSTSAVDFKGSTWSLNNATVNGKYVNITQSDPAKATSLDFDSNDNFISGQLPCNQFSTQYQAQVFNIQFQPLVINKKFCSESIDTLENQIAGLLQSVTQYQINNDELALLTSEGNRLVFIRQ